MSSPVPAPPASMLFSVILHHCSMHAGQPCVHSHGYSMFLNVFFENCNQQKIILNISKTLLALHCNIFKATMFNCLNCNNCFKHILSNRENVIFHI